MMHTLLLLLFFCFILGQDSYYTNYYSFLIEHILEIV